MIDVWTKLQRAVKPIVLYGMGNGADKILAMFERYGIKVSGFFASDEFVRGQVFHGFKVLTYAQTCELYDDFIIVLAFATSRPEVLERIYALAEKHEFYAPDVPVVGDETFEYDYTVRELLADDWSRHVFDNIINFKLSGDISYLKNAETNDRSEFLKNYESYADLGAYTGDTIINAQKIIAFEPDIKNYNKLIQNPNITAYNIAAWSHKTDLPFDTRGGRNSRIGGTNVVQADSLDNILNGESIDYIKYDVEGAEYEALTGSIDTIKKYSPDLAVSLYHRSGDIFKLVLYVHELNPAYKLYMRKFPYVPAWDLNLFAIN
ncbi:MAG: FkbM family methyltransferase [Oscillospiraceae bacterium]|nr:FkbM family methyltransferase [Oscillospiraceae bacterium]